MRLALKRLAMCAYAAAVWTYRDLKEAAGAFLEALVTVLTGLVFLSPLGWVWYAVMNLREAYVFRIRIVETTTWRKRK